MNKIFVSMACYDDYDVIATCKDLLAKASESSALRIVVALQTDTPERFKELDELQQVEVHVQPKSWATGVGKARNFIYSLLQDEPYFLQVDCHMRFQPRWDETLFAELAECPEKAVLSTLPPEFIIETGELLSSKSLAPKPARFIENVPVSDFAEVPPGLTKPPKIAHIAASVVFCSAAAIKASPPDPYYHYYGEELSHSLRWWTRGYDIYAIRPCVAHHAYQHNNLRPAVDSDLTVIRHWRSIQRVTAFLRQAPRETLSKVALTDIELYELGDERTVASWEAEFGIDLANRKIIS